MGSRKMLTITRCADQMEGDTSASSDSRPYSNTFTEDDIHASETLSSLRHHPPERHKQHYPPEASPEGRTGDLATTPTSPTATTITITNGAKTSSHTRENGQAPHEHSRSGPLQPVNATNEDASAKTAEQRLADYRSEYGSFNTSDQYYPGIAYHASDPDQEPQHNTETTSPVIKRRRVPSAKALHPADPVAGVRNSKPPPVTERSSYTSNLQIDRSWPAASGNKAFPCPLAAYGCTSAFGSKNEWKRHVNTQHMRLGYWRCDQCSWESGVRKPNDFNRKDLFIQHIRRMHPVEASMSGKKNKAKTSTKGGEEELALQDAATRCYRALRSPPEQSKCLFCEHEFYGAGSWDERMEHVGRHMEVMRKSNEPVDPREWRIDEWVQAWMAKEGIIGRAGPKGTQWVLDGHQTPDLDDFSPPTQGAKVQIPNNIRKSSVPDVRRASTKGPSEHGIAGSPTDMGRSATKSSSLLPRRYSHVELSNSQARDANARSRNLVPVTGPERAFNDRQFDLNRFRPASGHSGVGSMHNGISASEGTRGDTALKSMTENLLANVEDDGMDDGMSDRLTAASRHPSPAMLRASKETPATEDVHTAFRDLQRRLQGLSQARGHHYGKSWDSEVPADARPRSRSLPPMRSLFLQRPSLSSSTNAWPPLRYDQNGKRFMSEPPAQGTRVSMTTTKVGNRKMGLPVDITSENGHTQSYVSQKRKTIPGFHDGEDSMAGKRRRVGDPLSHQALDFRDVDTTPSTSSKPRTLSPVDSGHALSVIRANLSNGVAHSYTWELKPSFRNGSNSVPDGPALKSLTASPSTRPSLASIPSVPAASTIIPPSPAFKLPNGSNNVTAPSKDTNPTITPAEVHDFRQQLRAMEQQQQSQPQQPTEREQDLEMVLANVWDALSRTDSLAAHPESAVWRLVKRFAPNVLGNAQGLKQFLPPPAGASAAAAQNEA